ncbi:SAM-dependent methyltransferase [Streptomyces sp. NPDC007901]|uniref:SAM-dependent methyltransferase n=1 Tax=Streptomyces sp. NPDC007901 TaxID=3364785 RepID=UPI0036E834F7
MTDQGFSADYIDTSVPHSARMYDWFLDGKDHYAADVAAAKKVMTLMPGVKDTARSNREFMHRATRYLSQAGVTQFLDVGTGIPTEPNLHQVAQRITPNARVLYADNDPIVLRHAEALLLGTPEGRTAYIHADIRRPEVVLSYAQDHLDFTRPIGLSLVALMQFVTDDQAPYEIVKRLLDPLVPGSYLMLSHVTWEFDPEIWERVDAIYRAGGTPVKARSHDEVTRFFDGLEMCDPGVILSTHWRPDDEMRVRDEQPLYVGVARKI